MVELLAPAGSFESLKAAVHAGADAVYIGGSQFGARAYADNPDEEHLNKGIDYCHLHSRKLYMTVNTLLKEDEMEQKLFSYLLPYYKNGLDAVIVQDFGVLELIRSSFPDMEIHGSTQMTVTSADGAELLKKTGVTRVVPARELSLSEIRTIIEKTGIEVESFIHGAMCYCYSGQCLLSSMIGGRSGNRGRCAQPCRLPYTVQEQPQAAGIKKGKAQYLLSMKDMCTIDRLPELIEAGISSFKIEGRMKRPEYTAGVVAIYRKYIDRILAYGASGYRVEEEDRRMLLDLYNRGGFSDGYYSKYNGKYMMALTRPNHLGTEAARIRRITQSGIQAEALETLHKKDVLELPNGNETVLSEDVKKGSLFLLTKGKGGANIGGTVYRTKNEFLLESLRDKYIQTDYKEKIKGELKIFRDSPAILKLQCHDVQVECRREIAETAKNAPASKESVIRQMKKTGQTIFEFESLTVTMEDGLFIPVKALNELRREGLDALTAAILEKRRGTRRLQHQENPEDKVIFPEKSAERKCCLTVSVMTREQTDAVLSFLLQRRSCCQNSVQEGSVTESDMTRRDLSGIDAIYFDTLLLGRASELEESCRWLKRKIAEAKRLGCRCFLDCPPVWRFRERRLLESPYAVSVLSLMDGFLLHTVDEVFYFQNYINKNKLQAELAAGESLYAYNSRALSFWQEQGISRMTYSAELNVRELSGLLARYSQSDRRNVAMELTVYGHQQLMQSAQCVVNNTKGCTKKTQITYLRDRKNACFPVINRCNICCNTIYNCVPLQLGGCMPDIRRLAPAYCRLSFTIENAEETRRILSRYAFVLAKEADADDDMRRENGSQTDNTRRGCEAQAGDISEGTRGHFRRGVE